jgi:hypothetical protein
MDEVVKLVVAFIDESVLTQIEPYPTTPQPTPTTILESVLWELSHGRVTFSQ